MSPIEAYLPSLHKLFERKRVAPLAELRRALGVRSRTTVFFALRAAGYFSSYSHAGRYYTLRQIPEFDAHGLWFFGEIRFSKHGTLRATVVVLVREAPAGRTHEELEVLLGLRVHDTLRSLVETRTLGRQRVQSVYVYLDSDPQRAAAQFEERRRTVVALVPEPVYRASPILDPPRVVQVLVTVIQAPKDNARAIAARLRANGLVVSDEQVEAVFMHYELGKKTARSRSPRSRR
jgi:hypothetical protein